MAMTDALLLVLWGEMPLHLPFCCLGTNRQRPFHAQRLRVRSLQTTTQPQTLLRTTPFFQTSMGFPVLKSVPALEQSIWKPVPRTGRPFWKTNSKNITALHFVSDSCALVPCLVFLHHQRAFAQANAILRILLYGAPWARSGHPDSIGNRSPHP